jgi:RNA polymerase sigma-70 factor (ECF subfamily)
MGILLRMSNAGEFIPTRQSLLSRLKDWNDQEGWKVFFDTYWKLIYNAALKAGLTDAEAQDVVQETILSVLKSMPRFEYDARKGSFKVWLMRLTSWRITDQLRRRQKGIEQKRRAAETSTRTETIERVADPVGLKLEALWDDEWEKNLIEAAIERVKRKVDPKHYQAFDLYVFKKWPVSRVARTLRINPGKVYLVKHRINNLIRKEITYLQNRPI